MGDRGNIAIRQSGDPERMIFLYTHWGGSECPAVLQRALAKRWRWNDEAYLTRIVFDELAAGDSGNETGYGISTMISDNEHPILAVDGATRMVGTVTSADPTTFVPRWSFEDFIALPDPGYAVSVAAG